MNKSLLWSTNYKSFKNLGFGTADEEFSYENSRHIITVEERYQFFNDVSDILEILTMAAKR